MSYTNVIEEIENLPHYREFTCNHCGYKQKAYILTIQVNCENCHTRMKVRGYASIGSEIEDVVDAVLAWIGQNKEYELAMERKHQIDEYQD